MHAASRQLRLVGQVRGDYPALVETSMFWMKQSISVRRRAGMASLGSAFLLGTICFTNAQPSQAPPERQPTPMGLEPVFRIIQPGDKHRFVTPQDVDFKKLKPRSNGPLFMAVAGNEWPTGLVPVFAVVKANRVELRRQGLSGEENSTEPLFFALPPEDEPNAAKVAGRWECRAVRATDSTNFLVWELAAELEKVSGRFNQDSEYRVAFITGGTFRSNRLELRVEYLRDAYVLTGEWQEGKLKGDWRRTDEEERGTWEAIREAVRPPPRGEIVGLFEWRRASDNARYYAVEGEEMTTNWERSPRPLCRVWRPDVAGGK